MPIYMEHGKWILPKDTCREKALRLMEELNRTEKVIKNVQT